MNNEEKILSILEALAVDVAAVKVDVAVVKADVVDLKLGQQQTNAKLEQTNAKLEQVAIKQDKAEEMLDTLVITTGQIITKTDKLDEDVRRLSQATDETVEDIVEDIHKLEKRAYALRRAK